MRHDTHFDNKLKKGNNIITLEVRSSFNYITSIERVLTGAFSIIGTYTTSYKHKETEKDFFITIIHRYKNDQIINLIYNKIELYIIGGVSKHILLKYGKNDEGKLKQKNASYKIISPITSVPDVENLINEILFK